MLLLGLQHHSLLCMSMGVCLLTIEFPLLLLNEHEWLQQPQISMHYATVSTADATLLQPMRL